MARYQPHFGKISVERACILPVFYEEQFSTTKDRRMTQQLVKKTFLFLSALLLLAANLNATVYTVNSTSDANTGAGNAGTFRYCIGRVNIGSGGDTIKFSVTGTIATSTSLPIIKAATIDGTSAPGYAGVPLIEVTDGATSAYGITIDADGVVITGLSITGFGNGIYINASGCTIQRCYIGITPNEVIQPNNIGLFVNGRVNKIGGAGAGNVICGNTSHGIYVFRDSNSIKGNYIGTDVTGTLDWGNAGHGIYLQSDSNMIGGSTGGERNLISGNGGSGISLSSGSYNVIKGNYIGTDFSGTVALGNTVDGITLGGSYNDIGGIGSGNRNIISGNSGSGISIQSFSNKIIDNYIGTDVNGVLDLGNTGSGITVSSSSNTIGGIAAGQGNLISGNNGDGITITSGGNVTAMYGNYIGTDKSGSVTIGNTGSGITIAANNCTIGGNTSGHRNLISGNAQTGISLTGSTNTVRGNYIGTDANGVADLGNTQAGISVQNTSNTIGGSSAGQGNLISGNNGGGVVVTAAAASIGIYGNRIGTDKSGSVTIGNTGSGITIASFNCTIGGNTAGHRNVISGNSQTGITLTGSSNAVMGNYIGTDANGVEDLGNTAAGIAIQNGGNIIGGSGGGQGNLISGNNGGGIGTVASASLTVIKGNYIGTDVSGTVAIGNTGRGIILNSSGNTIGGSTAGDRNIISGNSTAGMLIAGSNNNVMGNYVGTNATGTAAIKNNQDGISVAGTNNIIGGNSIAGEGNLLSGNGTNGIITTAANNTIKGNYIGTNAAGTVAVPNLFNGVRVQSVSTIVGGTGAGEGVDDVVDFHQRAPGFVGPVAKMLGGADFSFVVGLAVSSGLYLLLCRGMDDTEEKRAVEESWAQLEGGHR